MIEALAVLGGYLLGSLPFGTGSPVSPRRGHPHAWERERRREQRLPRLRAAARDAVALLDLAKGFAAALLGLWAGGALVGVLAGGGDDRARAPRLSPLREGRKDGRDGGRRVLRARAAGRALCVGVWLARLPADPLRLAGVDRHRARARGFVLLSATTGLSSRSPPPERPRSSSSTATTSAGSSAAPSTASSSVREAASR